MERTLFPFFSLNWSFRLFLNFYYVDAEPLQGTSRAFSFKNLNFPFYSFIKVNGTQLAAGCRDGIVIVWSYPTGEILFQINKDHSVAKIKWNPFRENVFASRYDVKFF